MTFCKLIGNRSIHGNHIAELKSKSRRWESKPQQSSCGLQILCVLMHVGRLSSNVRCIHESISVDGLYNQRLHEQHLELYWESWGDNLETLQSPAYVVDYLTNYSLACPLNQKLPHLSGAYGSFIGFVSHIRTHKTRVHESHPWSWRTA